MLKKSFVCIALASSLFNPVKTEAAGIPIVAPQYGVWCETSISAMEFLPGAMIPFEQTSIVLETQLYMPVLLTIQQSSLTATQSISAALKKVSKTTLQEHNTLQAQSLNAVKALEEQNKSIEEHIKTISEKNKNMPFNDERGDLSKQYFKNVCSQNKIITTIAGVQSREEQMNKVNMMTEKFINDNSKVASVVSSQRQKVQDRYKDFCSEDDKRTGLCDTVSLVQNGDLDFDLFFTPSGNAEENRELGLFKTKYTYNKSEAFAASSYMDNVVLPMNIEPPTSDEIKDIRKQNFVSLYNNYNAATNLARQAFVQSYINRRPLNDEGVLMSKLDHYHYLLQQYGEKNANFMASGEDYALQLAIYASQSLNTRLNMELYKQEEMSKLLDAAILSLEQNKPIEFKYLDNRK